MDRGTVAAMGFSAVIAFGASARANGRFPFAQYVLVGPGDASDEIVLRTSFGLVISRDAGATFHWVCEQSLDYSGLWDPSVAIASDGTVSAGLPDGLIQTLDDCEFDRNQSAGSALIQDLSNDPTGQTILAIEAIPGTSNHVLLSADAGRTFVAQGAGLSGALPQTVEAAPSQPQRVYVSTMDEFTRSPKLYRSDDQGVTLTLTATDFLGGTDAFIAGVDRAKADTVWVRSNFGNGTLLLRSDDAGSTFARVIQSSGSMLGFALSDDGTRVWAGGPDDGLWRSNDGGATFDRVSDLHIACLRYHAGALYICTDWLSDGFALARWNDGDSAPVPLLYFADINGAFTCPAGTTETDVCAARWPVQRGNLLPPMARPDAGPDVAMDALAVDTSTVDATDPIEVGMDDELPDVIEVFEGADGRDVGIDGSFQGSEPDRPRGACSATPGRTPARVGALGLVIGLALALGSRRSRSQRA